MTAVVRHDPRADDGKRNHAPRIAVVGATGFIGSHVLDAARSAGIDAFPVKSIRVDELGPGDLNGAAQRWQFHHRDDFSQLCASLEGCDVVVNAAGLAEPGASYLPRLLAANAVQPAVIGRAARRAGVRRLVHVSSAAVQGRRDPLDETPRYAPLSPYGRSKVEGERAVLEAADEMPLEVVIYRPTSVQAESRSVTRRLAQLASLPVTPILGTGAQAVPVALVDNVAAGIVFSATVAEPPRVAVQPWEGLTTRGLIELFGPRKIVSIPPVPAATMRRAITRCTGVGGSIATWSRGVELALWGQAVDATSLTDRGFVAPLGLDAWHGLADRMRRSPKGRRAD